MIPVFMAVFSCLMILAPEERLWKMSGNNQCDFPCSVNISLLIPNEEELVYEEWRSLSACERVGVTTTVISVSCTGGEDLGRVCMCSQAGCEACSHCFVADDRKSTRHTPARHS